MSQKREVEHFAKLIQKEGTTWWGNLTPAGQLRLNIRGRLTRDYLKVGRKAEILEIGCGIGEFTKRLISCGARVVAIDVTPELITEARKNISSQKVTFQVANAEELPFKSDRFDAVVGNAILHHLNLKRALLEIKRILKKKKGKIIFFEPNMLNPHIYLERHLRFLRHKAQLSPQETAFYRWKIKRLFLFAGFQNVKVKPFDFLHPILPDFVIPLAKGMGSLLEKLPLFKEIAGSLLIKGELNEE